MDDVANFPGLMTRKRSRNWYYRAVVPEDLRDIYGRREIVKSLGTEDRTEAERTWYEASAKMRDEFERKRFERDNPEMRARSRPESRQQRLRRARYEALHGGSLLKLTRSSATELARQWFRKEIADRWAGFPNDIDEAIGDARSMLADLANPDDTGTITTTQDAAHGLLLECGYEGDANHPEFGHLAELLRQAMLTLEHLHLERLLTGEDKGFRAHLFGTSDAAGTTTFGAGPAPSPSFALKPALDQFANAATASRSSSDQAQHAKVDAWHQVIRCHFGDDFDLPAMKARDIEGFLNLIARIPANRRKKYPSLSVVQAVEAGERDGQKPISERVRADYERELRRFVRWCRRNEYLANDPFEFIDRHKPRPGDRKLRTPYQIAELRTLFSRPLYTGCRDDEHGFNKPGENKPRRGRFWLPLLGLFTGARAGELCQLRVRDIMRTEAGTPYLAIRNDGEWMTVKTRNAIRDIPKP